jgi:hypothetical protein
MTSTQVTPACDPSFTPAEGFVRTGALDTATGEEIGDVAARYASRTIQVADGPIASGVDAGARR